MIRQTLLLVIVVFMHFHANAQKTNYNFDSLNIIIIFDEYNLS